MTQQPMAISQTLIKAVLQQDACPLQLRRRFIDGEQIPPSDLMNRGKYFEHYLIGATRGGEVPVIEKLKKGGISQAEKDLNELITYAKVILDDIGLDVSKGQSQVELKSGLLEGHLDHINADIMNPDRKAIYDVKYTETRYDDRWNGWADFDSMVDQKIQASQYIMLYQLTHGHYVPYYFLVFGKSFWCRIIKVVVTEQTMVFHRNRIAATQDKIAEWSQKNWPAAPEFVKCGNCHFNSTCKQVATKPTIEIFQI